MPLTDIANETCGPNIPPKEGKLWGVFYLNKRGVSQSAIVKTVKLPKSTVQNVVCRIKRTGSPLYGKRSGA
ncbi:hypothetical protein INT48_001692 [Thamnidium elegans]|uniref:Uncharacterized protein n=1 Tax=Thamnidium elegans TaxID=101142 RepID=A0A8H7VYD9_9FUNG|nr:hypothetical protein INT48_001692 [Thamnidium elegans]